MKPSHLHASLSEAVVMADRAAVCHALPDVSTSSFSDDAAKLVACPGLMLLYMLRPGCSVIHLPYSKVATSPGAAAAVCLLSNIVV